MAKETKKSQPALTDEVVMNKIYLIRGQKVMLDRDLAEMYGVETRILNQAVKRNRERFPKDFMFQLNNKESENLKSQIVISSWGGSRKLPFAFTEQGVAMLSSVLNSAVAIQVNIRIIRIFTKMREMLLTNKDILLKLEKLEKDVTTSKQDIANIFEALKQLLTPPAEKRIRIGFKPDEA
ncbi:ORF6N domain-containing protein [Parafilimonas terrae]|uniref:ORF6N domain-containing protein n=1 Tax=Parafilimonas terrae TaxID=1465490 RepID=A0A1I5TEF2_9BACT|nr:ORF6N domain-containing protein [Parafilimonas terrae]SFP81423.1 ORF6N domain-containing protein [Parafilimonas terrae]